MGAKAKRLRLKNERLERQIKAVIRKAVSKPFYGMQQESAEVRRLRVENAELKDKLRIASIVQADVRQMHNCYEVYSVMVRFPLSEILYMKSVDRSRDCLPHGTRFASEMAHEARERVFDCVMKFLKEKNFLL